MRPGTAISTLVLLATVLSGFSAEVAPKKPAAKLVSLENLRSIAFTPKYRYVLGEPVFLWVVFANKSYVDKFEVEGYLHPANDFEIKIARAGQMPERFTAGFQGIAPALTFKVLPRQIYAERWMLCYEPKHPSGFMFDKPGDYTITCKMRLMINKTSRIVTFPKIEITVVEAPASEKEALGLLMRPECAEDLQRKRARDETAALWQELVRRFPDSVWAPYGRLLLAWHAWDKAEGDYGRVAEQFETLSRGNVRFPLMDYVYYGYAACQDRLGRPLEALRWLYKLQRTFPVSPYFRAGSPLFKKYIYRQGWQTERNPWYLCE